MVTVTASQFLFHILCIAPAFVAGSLATDPGFSRRAVQCSGESCIPAKTSALLQNQIVRSNMGSNYILASEYSDGLFATVPVHFVIITKQDGTGNLSESFLNTKMDALRKTYSGGDPYAVSQAGAEAMNAITSTPDTCGEKCDLALCYEDGKYKNIVDLSGCWCEEDYCSKWTSLGKSHGPRADAQVGFTLQGVSYVVNDEWHDQCCCAHAGGLSYEPKQLEIMDQLIDKTTVRSVTTIIVCDMKSTMGMSTITGSKGCEGGPGILLTHTFDDHTLAHEFGHYFGLYHTFNEYCRGEQFGTCKSEDVCDESKNFGDYIDDTPVHKKQGSCTDTWDIDSCPGGGTDPLDNVMSYSGCKLSRFTPGQVAKMRQTITDYYPAYLTTADPSSPPTPKDLTCDPSFPSLNGEVPDGYIKPPAPTPEPGAGDGTIPGPNPTPSCNLETGQCDTHDKQGCNCHDASICCAEHGCGGTPGMRQCLPCEWKAWGETAEWNYTKDSCL